MSEKWRCKHIQTAIADLEAGYQGGQETWTPSHPFSAVKLRDRNGILQISGSVRITQRRLVGISRSMCVAQFDAWPNLMCGPI